VSKFNTGSLPLCGILPVKTNSYNATAPSLRQLFGLTSSLKQCFIKVNVGICLKKGLGAE